MKIFFLLSIRLPGSLRVKYASKKYIATIELRNDIIKGLQKLTNPEFIEDEEDEDEVHDRLEDQYTINDELNDFKINSDSHDVQSKTNPGFQDVDENIIKSEDL